MLHVIMKGPVAPEDVLIAFQPLEFAEGENRFKATEAFLSQDKTELLVRSLVIERGFRKHFYVRIFTKDGQLHLGLDSHNQPDKSDAVKRLLGLYAWLIMQSEAEETIVSTNIEPFLREPAV